MLLNVHERNLSADPIDVGALLDSLATADDRLWPRDRWPAIRLDRPLAVGARGGHGPIRYTVERYEPGRAVTFRFTRPPGFRGTHAFIVQPGAAGGTVLRHELVMDVVGGARVTWPVVFRPLHDALIEDALDRAAAALDETPLSLPWSRRVRVLRAILRRLPRRRQPAVPRPRGSIQPPLAASTEARTADRGEQRS